MGTSAMLETLGRLNKYIYPLDYLIVVAKFPISDISVSLIITWGKQRKFQPRRLTSIIIIAL